MCHVYISSVCLLLLCFPHKKGLCFLSGPKPRLLPLISCFSPAPAASNYPIPPAGPPQVVWRSVPVSKTTGRVTWAWHRRLLQLGKRILHQFSFLIAFFSSAAVGSQLLAWFLTACFSVPEMGWVRPRSQFQSLSALAMDVLESSSTRMDLTGDGHEPRKVMGMTKCHSEDDTWSFSVGQRRTYRLDLMGWPFYIVLPNGIKFLRLPSQTSLLSNPDVFLYSNSSSFPTCFQCLAVLWYSGWQIAWFSTVFLKVWSAHR